MTVDFDELRKLGSLHLVDPLSAQWQPSILDNVRRQITQDFQEAWSINDAAHRYRHFSEVEAVANYINHRQQLQVDCQLILYAAFFHDLFSWSRDNHHKLSAEWIRTTSYPLISSLLGEDRELVAGACEHHRASGIGMLFPSMFAELICAADRGWPGQINAMIKRCQAGYAGKPHLPSEEEVNQHVVMHLKDKFGTQGYARLPTLYTATFGDIIRQRQEIFDSLTLIDGQISPVEDIPFTPIV